MAEPTLQEVFGGSATQDENTVTISKSDLAAIGLTAKVDNTAESLFAAIVQLAQQNLTEDNRDTNIDQSVTITDNLPNLVTRNDENYRQESKTINFEKEDDQSTFNPDDY